MGSLYYFVKSELSRGYQLEHDEERYEARREKVYTFMKIPRELEKFLGYGFLQCIDAFLYLFTFLPIRFTLAFITLVTSPAKTIIRLSNRGRQRTLQPSEIVDLLKGTILIITAYVLSYIDTAMVYHMIKSQSVIKLYLFYNMLEMADRLFSVFGQDIIDALFWTATEPRRRKREHLGLIPHLFLAMTYVFLHSVLILFQATTLNVAINSSNKALLTIMMSNNFVELKSSVFKKFDKSNLFQLSCADVRERFHLIVLLLVVVLQTMKEYMWREERFWVLLPDCLMVLLAEILVDWIKHAFITRFNEISAVVYRDYTLSLAYDLAQTRQKHAFTDHSDLVARRMGFIPLPLGVLVSRIITQSLKISSGVDILIILLAYFGLTSFRILNGIVALGKACDLIETHHKSRTATKPEETKNEPEAFCRSQSVDSPRSPRSLKSAVHKTRSVSHSPPRVTQRSILRRRLTEESEGQQRELAFQPMFSNSTVSLTSLCLNEEIFDDVMEPTLVYENSNGKDL